MSNTLLVHWPDGEAARFSTLWLRDNCQCADCRVILTQEKRFHIASVPLDYQPSQIEIDDSNFVITWPEGHRSRYSRDFLVNCSAPQRADWQPWPPSFMPTGIDFDAFLEDKDAAIEGIQAFLKDGAIRLLKAPTAPNTLEALSRRLGPIRELLFERIHNVQVDPQGYNVAHTNLPLPPHNDFASYSWPPSVQALHMLVNEAEGGLSTVTDGWAALASFRETCPEHFDTLTQVNVPFREFDEHNETFAVAPMIQLDALGAFSIFRYSNQLMQCLNPMDPTTSAFYEAYHVLSSRILSGDFTRSFRLNGGEMLLVAAHRVLHGREAILSAGKRHLQDAYFEHDNVRNMLTVLSRNYD